MMIPFILHKPSLFAKEGVNNPYGFCLLLHAETVLITFQSHEPKPIYMQGACLSIGEYKRPSSQD